MKNKDLLALSFLSEFDGGTLTIYKTGDVQYGENWEIEFSVGYGKNKFRGEGATLFTAIENAVENWPSGKKGWINHIK